MKIKTIYIVTTIFLLLTISTANAQLMENNNAKAKSEKKVKMEIGYYKHLPNDTYWPDSLCMMWRKEFDVYGRLVTHIDHWHCGQIYCIYEYEYDQQGNCVNSWISYQSNNFKRLKMKHKYNEKGYLIERWPKEVIPSYPLKESYKYNKEGQAIMWQQWKKANGDLYIDFSKDWNGEKDYNMIEEYEMCNDNNQVLWTVIRAFELYKK